MSKWGLLRGLGQGVAQAGTMLAADQFDRMKEERLEKYRQSAQQKQWERDDQTRAEDRNFAEQSELRGITERAQNRVQDQANLDRDYEQRQSQFKISSDLVNKQIQQINQEIDITGMELERQRDIQNVWDQIQDTEDEQQLESLFDRYRRLTGTDKDDRYSLHTVPEYDDMGERVGTTVYTHNSRTNEVTPYSGNSQQVDRGAQLREALGLSPPGTTAPSTQPDQRSPAQTTENTGQPPDQYSMGSIAQQRGDAGAGERAAGLLRRITPNLQPQGQIAQIEARINMELARNDGPPVNNRQLDDQRLALTRLIQNPETPEEIRDKARQLFDRIR